MTLLRLAARCSLVAALCVPACAQSQAVRSVHVFVALADNQHQGIVPVPARLGNGRDAAHNLYWGAAAGVRTFFARSADWKLLRCGSDAQSSLILERCIFVHRSDDVLLVADAYRGDAIEKAIIDFLDAAAGGNGQTLTISAGDKTYTPSIRGRANLLAYVGHDGLMDFRLTAPPRQKNGTLRETIILACASKQYFGEAVRSSGAKPLLWTTGLMAPEAYTLKAALDGWIAHDGGEQIRERSAVAYDRYQHCGIRGARRLFATGP